MISRHKYQILFWLCIAATISISLMPGGGKPLFEMQDKVAHAVIYGLLFFVCARGYSNRFPLWALALVLAGFGLSMELAQSMTTYRHADGWDMLANTTGILLVWPLTLLHRKAE
ncbi:MAG: VanZ family protein [Porticoccaceae bacterium]|nr:VanZ family protein [Porticoccaceae bacterium]